MVFVLPQEPIRKEPRKHNQWNAPKPRNNPHKVMTNNWLIFERGYGKGLPLIDKKPFFQSQNLSLSSLGSDLPPIIKISPSNWDKKFKEIWPNIMVLTSHLSFFTHSHHINYSTMK